MAVTATPFRTFEQKLLSLSDSIDFDTADIYIVLCTSSYVPDRDAHDFYADVTNELSTAGGYTAGGLALTGVTVGVDGTGHFAYIDADDAVWNPATFSADLAVIFKWTGSAATSPLIGWVDFGGTKSPSGQPFTIEWAVPSLGGVVKVG